MSRQSQQPFRITLRSTLLVLTFWGIGVWLVLQLQHSSIGLQHSICGPWGCGPPLPALLACHGFWLVLFAPPVLAAGCFASPHQLLKAGTLLVAIGLLTLIGISIWQATNWIPVASELQRSYFLQRCLFVVAVQVDMPLFELIAFGLLLTICGWTRTAQTHDPMLPRKNDASDQEQALDTSQQLADSSSTTDV